MTKIAKYIKVNKKYSHKIVLNLYDEDINELSTLIDEYNKSIHNLLYKLIDNKQIIIKLDNLYKTIANRAFSQNLYYLSYETSIKLKVIKFMINNISNIKTSNTKKKNRKSSKI